jgi:hypothetical protein
MSEQMTQAEQNEIDQIASKEEVERIVREQVQTVCGAVRELARVLLACLNDRYRETTASLEQESSALWNELSLLQKSYEELRPRLEAQHRVTERQIDECLASGDDRGAAAKRAQIEEEQNRLTQLAGKIAAHRARMHAIPGEMRRIAGEVLADVYELFPLASFSLIAATLDLLDGLRDGLFRFAESVPGQEDPVSPLIRRFYFERLLPTTMPGSNAELSRRVDRWFGPAR